MAFKTASKKSQAKARRVLPKHTPADLQAPLPEEVRENLVKKKKNIEEKLKVLKNLGETPSVISQRQSLRLEHYIVEEEIKAVNKLLGFKKLENLDPFLIEVIKKDVPAFQWKTWVDRAVKIQRATQEAAHEEITGS